MDPAPMRVIVDRNCCQGHARCYALAPQLFVLDDEGYIIPGDIAVPAELEMLATRVVRACPERALSLGPSA